MDTPNFNPATPLLPKPANKSWVYLVIVLVLGIATAAYFYYFNQQDSDDANNTAVVNANTNTTVNANVNVNTNSNANLNINDNANTAVNATERKITYQHLDHGFTIDVPTSWMSGIYGSGSAENVNLVSFNNASSDYHANLNGQVMFFRNTGSLESWVAQHATSLQHENTTISGPERSSINGQEAWLVTSTYRSTYNVNGSEQTDVSITRLGYLQRGQYVYEISIFQSSTNQSDAQTIINGIFNSFRFIDPKPMIALADFNVSRNAIAQKGYGLSVDWLGQPEELNLSHDPVTSASGVTGRTYEKVGVITNGVYKNSDLLNILQIDEGPSSGPSLYRGIFNPETKTLVYLMGKDDYQPDNVDIARDPATTIPALSYQAEIKIPNSAVVLAEQAYNIVSHFSDFTSLEKQFSDPVVGDVYLDTVTHCFIIKTADALVKRYHVKPNFVKVETTAEPYMTDYLQGTPAITWNDGSVNTQEYQSKHYDSGCGSLTKCQDVRTDLEIGGLTALKVTGQTSTGDKIYEFVNQDTKELKGLYDIMYMPQGEAKPTYASFVAGHPLVFWKEPLGHWIGFWNRTYQPGVECGKPVIYLYPEKETKVNVKVQPSGGLTVTEPAYPDAGWTVTAKPNGELRTEDGTYYPYLFWEGIGLNYQIPNRGFVVARKDINKFLKDKLASLGLNAQESQDFIDFWQAKLEVKPYAYVTFIDQPVFDQLAPLTVTPQPDQVIRVFMDYQPLDAPVSVAPQIIKTPARHGFTVVEWGGALHR